MSLIFLIYLIIRILKQISDKHICPNERSLYDTKCILRKEKTRKKIVISLSYYSKTSPCTAVFDLNASTWNKIQEDTIKAGPGGHLISFENDTRILYLGGFHINGTKLRTIYELVNDDHWMLWSKELPLPIGNDTFLALPTKFSKKCHPPSTPYGKISSHMTYFYTILKVISSIILDQLFREKTKNRMCNINNDVAFFICMRRYFYEIKIVFAST